MITGANNTSVVRIRLALELSIGYVSKGELYGSWSCYLVYSPS